MKKRVKGRTFSRKAGVRSALIVSVARALIEKEKITTTEAKAKEVARFVEKLVAKAKKGDLHAKRELLVYFDLPIVKKFIENVAPRFQARAGGYTRVVKLGPRNTDGAKMAVLEFVE